MTSSDQNQRSTRTEPETLGGCECDLEMACTVYTVCLEERSSVGNGTLLAWKSRHTHPTLLSVSYSPCFSSCSGPCSGLGKINAVLTACREIELVHYDPETWRAQARAASGTIPQ